MDTDTYHDANKENGARHTAFIVEMPRVVVRPPTVNLLEYYTWQSLSHPSRVASRHGSDSNSTGSPSSFHASIPPTTSVAFKSPMSCSDAAANELVYPS